MLARKVIHARAQLTFLLAACFASSGTSLARQAASVSSGSTPGNGEMLAQETLSFLAVDHEGQPVVGLQPEEIALKVDHEPRKIVSILPTSDRPRIIGVFFDTSSNRRGDKVVAMEVQATANFLSSVWHKGDGGFVVAFNDHPITLAKPTTDLRPIQAALQTIPKWDDQGGTAVYDALCSIGFGPQTADREKVFLVVTDFGDTSSHKSEDKMIQAMRVEGVRVFVIVRPFQALEDEQRPAYGLLNQQVAAKWAENAAEKTAEETGGDMFVVTNQKELDTAFRRFAGELQGSYRLNYESLPSSGKPPKKLELTSTRRDVVLHYPRN